MKKENFSEALGGIDLKYVDEAEALSPSTGKEAALPFQSARGRGLPCARRVRRGALRR